ncbi:MAG: helix-turn-helix domain-containing protein, partial [Actinobacteria bacterium]|nr:helix-turn-helix domain-containing protein [Actinomycetota bacterium]
MAESARYRALEGAGLLHPAPEAVVAEPFRSHPSFFAAFDKVQVKYEMLRANVLGDQTATAAAAAHGYSRASFYLVSAAFEQAGMVGLVDERPGRRG